MSILFHKATITLKVYVAKHLNYFMFTSINFIVQNNYSGYVHTKKLFMLIKDKENTLINKFMIV